VVGDRARLDTDRERSWLGAAGGGGAALRRRAARIYYAVAGENASLLDAAADAFVPALLVPAMAQGVDLRLRPPVSERLLGRLDTAQDMLVRFHRFRRATVLAQPRAGGEPVSGTAAHFSGGVDSTFTLLRSRQGRVHGTRPAEYLLFFKGLEQPLSALRDVGASIAAVARVAALTGTRSLQEQVPVAGGTRHN